MSALSTKKFYPVIHCISPHRKQGIGHALLNTRIAIKNGADGVFLIGHGMSSTSLSYLYENVRKRFPDIWIGINFLDISYKKDWLALSAVAKSCPNLDALWIDDIPETRLDLPYAIKIFGGVAFKYINPHIGGESLAVACEKAVRNIDVATTSGDATGSAPEITKLEAIKKNLAGRLPLALASGVCEENVLNFKPAVDIFLVASSIIERVADQGNFEYLVPEKVKRLSELIHM